MAPIIVIVVPGLTGFLLTSVLWPHDDHARLDPLMALGLRVSIGLGLGVGVCSYLSFALQVLNISGTLAIACLEALLSVGLFVAYRRRRRANIRDFLVSLRRLLSSKLRAGLYGALAVALSGGAVVANLLARQAQFGGWDAWTIWNMRARFIFRAGEDWVTSTFASDLAWSHPDYPLLIPMFIVRGWRYLGVESQVVPIWVSGTFIAATTALLVCGSGLLSTREKGAIAGLLALGTPFFLVHGMSQYADVALSFFLLAAVTLSCLGLRTPGKAGLGFWVLAGCSAALAAWTKNEGIVAAMAVFTSATVLCLKRSNWKETRAALAAFVGGGLPGTIVLAYFKIAFATPNVLVSMQTLSKVPQRILALDRYEQTIEAFGVQALTFGEWLVHPGVAVLVYGVAFGFAFRERVHETLMVASTLCFMLAVFFAVYITTPHDLAWHLGSSLNRLLTQLWPALILFFCLVTNGAGRLNRGFLAPA